MKFLLRIVALWFLALPVIGQKGFPVNVTTATLDYEKLSEYIPATVQQFGSVSGTRSTVATHGTQMFSLSYQIPAGKKCDLVGIQVTCDRPAMLQFLISQFPVNPVLSSSGLAETYPVELGGPNQPTTYFIPVNKVLREGGKVGVVAYSKVDGQEQPYFAFSLVGRHTANLTTTKPDYVIIGCTDSKGWGSMGNDANGVFAFGNKLYLNQAETALNKLPSVRAKGKSVLALPLGFGGAQSSDWVHQINNGKLNNIPYDCMVVAIGTNQYTNGSGAAALTKFKSDLMAFIDHRNTYRPDADIIFVTPGQTDVPAITAHIGAYRQAVIDVATDATKGGVSRRVYLSREENAFALNATATADLNFAPLERTEGGRLHPSDVGHTNIFNTTFYPVLQQTKFYQRVLTGK